MKILKFPKYSFLDLLFYISIFFFIISSFWICLFLTILISPLVLILSLILWQTGAYIYIKKIYTNFK